MASIPDPRDLPPDPRLPNQCPAYSCANIVSALASFYECLPHVDPSLVQRSPPDGWPEITTESLAAAKMHPAERVIELIRRLPYIDGDPRWITPETFPINYCTVVAKATAGTFMPVWMKTLAHNHFEDFPPWVLQLTTSVHRDGDIWLLDTMDGTVTKYIITGAVYPDPVGRYEEGDPRMWREKWCDDVTLPLETWLKGILEKHKKLQYLGLPRVEYPGVLWRDANADSESDRYKQTEELRNIYIQHGWPDEYRATDCRRSLARWLAATRI